MFSHVDKNNQPTMVDITDKKITARKAVAQALVQLPSEVRKFLQGEELVLKKGPVFQTAIVAATMAVKKTHELIPFCHQIPIESCKINITMDANLLVTITCEVKTTFKTGVEMEALQGASTAALVIYDMCKALTHHISILETRLIAKTGGKSTVLDRPLRGLVLTGGKSERMKSDKALLQYHGKPHAAYLYELLEKYCDDVFISARPDQWKDSELRDKPTLNDIYKGVGPLGGILSAFAHDPHANWLIVACDLPHINEQTLETLIENYRSDVVATAFKNNPHGFPEALCALYTPAAQEVFKEALKQGLHCPVKALRQAAVHTLEQSDSIDLANINTPEEFYEVRNEIN